jgi:UDP-glucose 4-epimerase
VSSGRDFSIKELYDAVVRAMGLPPDTQVEVRPRGPDDAFTILLDPSRTEEEFAWSVKTRLDDGVARSVADYEKNGVGETYTHLRTEEKKQV